jgi:hypothetical protein
MMSATPYPGCTVPEVEVSTPFCGVGDMLFVIYAVASIIAFL